jgi:uncharacterized membrane protein YdjX (TVP38/TMEM64 family)
MRGFGARRGPSADEVESTARVRRPLVVLVLAGALLAVWALSSFWLPRQDTWLTDVRAIVSSWGPFAPIVYTLVVIVEVVVAPIPGTLLYAPGGAIFGGFIGGTLSLVGNVVGAAIACVLGRLVGERVFGRSSDRLRFNRYRALMQQRGLWIVLLLRLNPLTSSDLVSYAAGVAGVPAWKVAAGTLVGMAPLCYVQAYFAQRVFELVPGRFILMGGALLIAVLVYLLVAGRSVAQ